MKKQIVNGILKHRIYQIVGSNELQFYQSPALLKEKMKQFSLSGSETNLLAMFGILITQDFVA